MSFLRFLGFSIVNNSVVGAYFAERLKVQRGIKGKTRSKVDELLICGIPINSLKKFVQSKKILFNGLKSFLSYKHVIERTQNE